MDVNKMEIKLQNSLTGKKETFRPIKEGEVLMYNCGPTVYNYAHLGNLRSYIFADTLRRMFEYNDFSVKQVINITDVGHLTSDADFGEDKIEKEAKKEGKDAEEITKFYTEKFFEDLDRLNIHREKIIFPKATEHIESQKNMIEKLLDKDFAYITDDAIYFKTSKFPEYQKLFGIDRSNMEEEFARVIPTGEKEDIQDFALWKFSKPGEHRLQEWKSPRSDKMGFPGWHIECSAMIKEILGETIDVHTGGIDHIPVHHTNEIAQSTCANEKPLANFWIHNAFLNVESGKMAKSEENFIRLQTILDKGFDPLSFRYLILTAHYSSPLLFSWQSLEASKNALERLKEKVLEFGPETDSNQTETYKEKFKEFINNDLDTPKALALTWDIIKDDSLDNSQKKHLILDFDKVFGLNLDSIEIVEIPEEVKKLIDEREKSRAEKDWQKSDEIRKKIENLGFSVKDTENGPKISKK